MTAHLFFLCTLFSLSIAFDFKDLTNQFVYSTNQFERDHNQPVLDTLHFDHLLKSSKYPHGEKEDECSLLKGNPKLHPCRGVLSAGSSHQDLSSTNSPIYAVLTQPYSDNPNYRAYIPAAHVKFLMSGGARVIPMDYRLSKGDIYKVLEQVDGLYIPGDDESILFSQPFLQAVFYCIQWGQLRNKEPTQSFPIVAVKFGLAAVLACQTDAYSALSKVDSELVNAQSQLNLLHPATSTYVYDSVQTKHIETLFNNMTVVNEVSYLMKIKHFQQDKRIGNIFVAVSSFARNATHPDEEWVAIVEGMNFPFFGLAFSIERIMHNYSPTLEPLLDFSKNSVLHAQHLANFFVDEARLSANQFEDVEKEEELFVTNLDAKVVASNDDIQLVYLFQ